MADIPGTNIISKMVPTDDADTFPTHDSLYGKGGHKEVADITARNAITSDRRSEGMEVWVISESKTYRLEGGIADSNWVEVTYGGVSDVTNASVLNRIIKMRFAGITG